MDLGLVGILEEMCLVFFFPIITWSSKLNCVWINW
jgi:hypothetical protein